ncbi:MAG TPA: hypothetical protein VGB00_09155 [Pyrinomonadaceae bacterium]|jgi:Ca2+-binding EF-hand superfamily protein
MPDKPAVLNYSDLWLKFGFLTAEELDEQIKIFETSDDKSTERYRYASFRKYLNSRGELTDDEINKYLHLAEIDEDEMMACAAVVDLLCHRNLTDFQFEKIRDALGLYGKWTEKVISREILFRKFRKAMGTEGVLTEDVFQEFIYQGNADIHRFLIWYADKNQLKLIAEKGASKAVRNIAKQMLRSRKFR